MEHASQQYDPAQIDRLIRRLETAIDNAVNAPTLLVQNAEPARFSDGMLVYADGTNWDPGSLEGIYARYNATWNKL